MSKKCPECGSLNIEYLFEEEDSWCKDCSLHFPSSDALIASVFDKITESMETLAEEFVDSMYDRVACEYRYYSMLTAEFYNNRAEAIAATVEEMKKEWKEQENE